MAQYLQMRSAPSPPSRRPPIFSNSLPWILMYWFLQLPAFRKKLFPSNPSFRKQKYWTFIQMALVLQMRFAPPPPSMGPPIFLNYLLWIQTERFTQLSAFRKNLCPLNPTCRKQKHRTLMLMALLLQIRFVPLPPLLGPPIFLNYLLWIQTQRFTQLPAFRKNLLPLNPACRKQKHRT